VRKLNVLYINHSSQISGAEVVLINLLNLVKQKNVYPIVILPQNGKLAKKIRKEKIQVEIVPIPFLVRTCNPLILINYFINYFLFSKSFYKIIKKYQIRIIHANSFQAAFYSLLVAKLLKIPLVWHMHDILSYRLFNKIFIKLTSFGVSKIICVSEAVKVNLTIFGVNSEKCKVIYNSINRSEFLNTNVIYGKFRKEYNISQDTILIGIIGQIAEWKGQEIFLNSISKVLIKFSKVKFIIVGDVISEKEEKYKKTLKKFIEKNNLEKVVFFTGFREDISQIITDLNIIVHTSIKPDPLPTIIIEGMALGKPVIATDVGGVRELITPNLNGLIIPPKDSQKLSQAILKMLSNPKLIKKMGKEGMMIADKKFAPIQNIRKINDIYQNINKKI